MSISSPKWYPNGFMKSLVNFGKNYDETAEPTMEGIAGTDSTGATINSGGQAVNLTDNDKAAQLTATTNSVTTDVEFDIALTNRDKYDFAILGFHNVRNSYPAPVSNQIRFLWDTDGAIAGATALTPTKFHSGLLGQRRPSLDFAGDAAATRVTISDAAVIQDLFAGGGTVDGFIEARSDGENNGGAIIDKSATLAKGWAFRVIDESAGKVKLSLRVAWTSFGEWRTDDLVINLNERTHVAVSYDSGSTGNSAAFHVNGVLVASSTTTVPTGSYISDVGADMFIGDRLDGLTTFDGQIDTARGWTLSQNTAELLSLSQGNLPTNTPTFQFEPDGINPDDSKWYEKQNNLDGTITGATALNAPDGDEFTLIQFDAKLAAFWFAQINNDGLTGGENTTVGQWMMGKSFTPTFNPDEGWTEEVGANGVVLSRTRGGRFMGNRRHGAKLRWTFNWSWISESDKAAFNAYYATVGGSLYPHLFSPDSDNAEPTYHMVRLMSGNPFTGMGADALGLTMVLEED